MSFWRELGPGEPDGIPRELPIAATGRVSANLVVLSGQIVSVRGNIE